MAKDSIEQALSVLEAEKTNLSPEQREQLVELSKTGEVVREDVAATLDRPKKRELTSEERSELLVALEARFTNQPKHYKRLQSIDFGKIKAVLEANSRAMSSLARMENTGGMPDLIDYDDYDFVFGDCSPETPNHRRGLTYDRAARMADEFGVDMMPEVTYRKIQEMGQFDRRTNSWLYSPSYTGRTGKLIGTLMEVLGRVLHGYRDSDAQVVIRNTAPCLGLLYIGWRGMLKVPRV